jgi:ADP-ribose pyrophosphatase
MSVRVFVLITCWVFAGLQAIAQGPAGIILYTETDKGIELLLADHVKPVDRGWAAFGGNAEAGESYAETAARETEEETRGYFRRSELLRRIEGQTPTLDGPFAFYFVKIDRVPVSEILKSQPPSTDRVYFERGPYAWVPLKEIERFFDPDTVTFPLRIHSDYLPQERFTDWVWPIWLHNLSVAMENGTIPWKQDTAAQP